MLRILLVFLTVVATFSNGSQFKSLQQNHRPQDLSNADIKYLATLSDLKYTDEVLDNILIPRVVGTPNHDKVFNYIKSELQKLKWHVEVDEFDDVAPKQFGTLRFRNIIATLNPNAERYLVLACHYDSKYFKDTVFVGATDSAVPCAMMLNLAKVMQKDLNSIRDKSNVNLKLVFFDGEEAFVNWGPTDSIYGARHLAEVYHNNRLLSITTGETISDLDRMDMLVLLDLIGHKNSRFYSNFKNTQDWYLRLADIEDRLQHLKLLKKSNNHRYFLRRAYGGYIEDDHIPFLRRNVPILHLISNPFPEEWHKPGDNRDIVDRDTVENINKILRAFVAEYLSVYLDVTEEHIPEKEL
ncbi:glutaminyl-peptide cyclotransferase [Anoplophora glabripennis]|uniref:glutaminyl-peptide cyclotransferase n=1 Tax=Anoplophora glabripennis TaxID=217634 RepID=UPI000873E778|nr:glutaminyl-peptide cyclotransferase [Anoplophora glabripennis]